MVRIFAGWWDWGKDWVVDELGRVRYLMDCRIERTGVWMYSWSSDLISISQQ